MLVIMVYGGAIAAAAAVTATATNSCLIVVGSDLSSGQRMTVLWVFTQEFSHHIMVGWYSTAGGIDDAGLMSTILQIHFDCSRS